MTDIEQKIEEFLKAADELTAEYWKRMNYTYSPPPTHAVEYSRKWAKVLVVEHQHDGTSRKSSVYAFICLEDGATKTLGVVKRGDIHKSATFSAPAKHARGNVFASNFRECITPHGIVYLK